MKIVTKLEEALILLQPEQVLYEITSKPDALGRVRFTMHWLTNYRAGHPEQEYDPEGRLHRCQCFFARLEPCMERERKAGSTIKVLEMEVGDGER